MHERQRKKGNRQKAAMYRKVRHSRLSVFAIVIIVTLLLIVIGVDSKSLMEKDRALKEREAQLTSQLESEQIRTSELQEFEK